MKAFIFPGVVLTGLLVGCGGDDLPNTKVTSAGLDTNQISLDLRVQAQDSELDADDNGVHFETSLYRVKSDGFVQLVDLAQGEKLEVTSEGMQPLLLDKNYYPSDSDRQAVDYSAQITDIVAGKEYTLNFNRGGNTNLTSRVSVLQETPFTVTPSATPLNSMGSLTLSWTPVTDYDYEVSFRFSCGANKDQYVQGIRFPNRSATANPVSPFVFAFDDYFTFPSDATDCALRATLWSYQDQSAFQDQREAGAPAYNQVNITSVRVQRISTAIQRN